MKSEDARIVESAADAVLRLFNSEQRGADQELLRRYAALRKVSENIFGTDEYPGASALLDAFVLAIEQVVRGEKWYPETMEHFVLRKNVR
jgi:hypothetical protein